MTDLLTHVPIGSDNALGWKEIADKYGTWAPTTVHKMLEELVAAGKIKRRLHRYRPDRTRHVYYREGA